MNTAIVYDTETSGMPDWSNPSDGKQQPHIVQLAALQVDLDSEEVLQLLDLTISPVDWEIPQEVVDIHGIDAAKASAIGVEEETAVELFCQMWEQSGRRRIGHSESFDMRIIRIAIKRHMHLAPGYADRWKEHKGLCTGWTARPVMGIKGRHMPKLTEAYEHFIGKPMENAHTAMGDAKATMELFFALRNNGHVPEGKP